MNELKTDIYQFQAQLGQRLALWSGFSIGAAAVMGLLGRRDDPGHRFRRGAASQFAGWGVVDLAIALLGLRSAERRAADPTAHAPAQQAEARASLRKILWINTALDVGYVTGGAVLAKTKGQSDRFWRGAGWGIVVQGGFLFFFDLIHALLLKDA